jgi:hypothetical protein
VVISTDRRFGATGHQDVGTSRTVRAFEAISYRFLARCAHLAGYIRPNKAAGLVFDGFRNHLPIQPGVYFE